MGALGTGRGCIYKDQDGRAWHLRYRLAENGVGKYKSVKLCKVDSEHETKDAPAVLSIAESFMCRVRAWQAVHNEQCLANPFPTPNNELLTCGRFTRRKKEV